MYTTRRFSSRYTLHTVYTGFKLHSAIYILTIYFYYHLFISTSTTRCFIHNAETPSFVLKVTQVHTQQITGKKTGFITTCSTTDFQLCVLFILWVLRDQQVTDRFLNYFFLLIEFLSFFFSKIPHFLIATF